MNLRQKAARIILSQCLKVKKSEEMLVLADEPLIELARLFYWEAQKQTKNCYLLQFPTFCIKNGLEKGMDQIMSAMDVVVAMTSISISHTSARRNACKAGARIISMPNIKEATFERIAKTDFKNLERMSCKLTDILSIGNKVSITSPNGTSLFLSIKNQKGYSDTGLVHSPGSFSNLPAGEASVAPVDSTTEGLLVIDSGMGLDHANGEKMHISIKKGKAVRITGHRAAELLRRKLSRYGPKARIIAEFGIGTNITAKLDGYSLEDEKVLGTIHIALGNNVSFGGKNDVPIHLDGVVHNASVTIDGRRILGDGQLHF